MNKKNLLLIVGVIILIIALIAGYLYFREDNENQGSWVCENGQWMESGNPSSPKPDEPCEIGGETDEYGCLVSAGYSWCEAQQKCIRTWEETCAIQLQNIEIGQTVSSPLVIRGEAPGTWFFEASFPIKLYDQEDELIAEGFATAEGEWMTTDMVPFEATLNFGEVQSGNGKLVFEKDNPSGLPENALSESIPVKFSSENMSSEGQIQIKVFFGNNQLTPNSCAAEYPVNRDVPRTEAIGQAAINELLQGPTQAEKEQGYYSSINEGVSLERLSIEDGIAQAEFNEVLEEGVSGSCKVIAIRSEIVNTLKQFPTVNDVVISIDGRTDDILQP